MDNTMHQALQKAVRALYQLKKEALTERENTVQGVQEDVDDLA